MWKRALDRILVVAFLAMLALPGVWMIADPPTHATTSASGEQFPALRTLLAKAPTKRAKVRAWAGWFRTRFPFRKHLIQNGAYLKMQLGLSTSPNVTIGKDGWLFYSGERTLESYRHVSPLRPHELAQWVALVDGWAKACASVGARLVIVIPPDKQSVYADRMPAWTAPVSLPSRLDQLVSLFAARTDIAFVDLRPAMALARRAGFPLYRRTDTHWNELGGFVASREIQRKLTRWFPALPIPDNAGALVRYLPSGGDLARFLGLQAHLSDVEVFPLAVQQHATFEYQNGALQSSSTHAGAPIRRGYVLHDSFKGAMASYLSEPFEDVAYYWTTHLNVEHMRRFAPDVVIIEIAEHFLMRQPSQIATGT